MPMIKIANLGGIMHKIVLSAIIIGTLGFVGVVNAAGDTTVTSVSYVTTELGKKQDNIPKRGTGLTESVVTYTTSAGTVGEKGVYQETGAYNSTTQKHLVEAKTVNAAVQTGLNNHLERIDDADGTLWRINTLSGTYVPHSN